MPPIHLVSFRHLRSVGNVAYDLSDKGDHSHFTEAFRKNPDSEWGTIPEEERYAPIARQMLNHEGLTFSTFLTSPYFRARRTGALVYPDAYWQEVSELRERSLGRLREHGNLPPHELRALYPDEIGTGAKLGLRWKPPDGESVLMDLVNRVDPIAKTLEERADHSNVILSSHMLTMVALHRHFARVPLGELEQICTRGHPRHISIGNMFMFHYSRENPWNRALTPKFSWLRTLDPVHGVISDWEPIP